MLNPHDIIKNVRNEGSAVVLELAGEIDMQCSTELRGEIMAILQEKPSALVVNMSQVTFMDSSGLATLVEALQWSRRNGGTFRLSGLQENVRNVFEISRLESFFEIYDSEAEAMAQ
ncbi:MAG: STAS domain-containing protein [Phycisphaerae bacterium]|nr:STAS domain-containing protein [Phycisphaerae bacterium]